MPSIQQLSVAASLLSSAFALPAGGLQFTRPNTLTGYSIVNVANPHFAGQNGPAAYKKTNAKFGVKLQEVTTTIASSVSPVTKGNVLLAQQGDADAYSNDGTDLAYLTPVLINGQQYLLDLDTGSSNLWIGGSQTAALHKYTPTGRQLPGNWTVSYADGTEVGGDVHAETVSIGETIVTQVAVGRAIQAPAKTFNTGHNGAAGSDGLLGLGFSSASTFTPKQNTWFDQAVSQGLQNVFAANLRPGALVGSYDFGFTNKSSYKGSITYVDVDHATSDGYEFWTVTPTKGERGVMDTGSTLVMLSDATTKAYYDQIPGAVYDTTQAGYTFPCDAKAPDYTIEFGAHKATIPGSFMVYAGVDGTTQCYGAIQGRGSLPFSIYGDRFFMAQYVVFDKTTGKPRIGFADKA